MSKKRSASPLDSDEEAPAKKVIKPKCQYGPACYRKNPDHIRDYDHTPTTTAAAPSSSAATAASSATTTGAAASVAASSSSGVADITKPHCPFGAKCYRKNPQHRLDEYHPPTSAAASASASVPPIPPPAPKDVFNAKAFFAGVVNEEQKFVWEHVSKKELSKAVGSALGGSMIPDLQNIAVNDLEPSFANTFVWKLKPSKECTADDWKSDAIAKNVDDKSDEDRPRPKAYGGDGGDDGDDGEGGDEDGGDEGDEDGGGRTGNILGLTDAQLASQVAGPPLTQEELDAVLKMGNNLAAAEAARLAAASTSTCQPVNVDSEAECMAEIARKYKAEGGHRLQPIITPELLANMRANRRQFTDNDTATAAPSTWSFGGSSSSSSTVQVRGEPVLTPEQRQRLNEADFATTTTPTPTGVLTPEMRQRVLNGEFTPEAMAKTAGTTTAAATGSTPAPKLSAKQRRTAAASASSSSSKGPSKSVLPPILSKVGGLPYQSDAEWPVAPCGRSLDFLFQLLLSDMPEHLGVAYQLPDLPLDKQLLQFFMCGDDGSCETWEPFNEGAKVAIADLSDYDPETYQPAVKPDDIELFEEKLIVGWIKKRDYPCSGDLSDWEKYGLTLPEDVPDSEIDCIHDQYNPVAGEKLSGFPFFFQGGGYPDCSECSQPMRFVFQMEGKCWKHPEGTLGGGFNVCFGGDGMGMIFQCKDHPHILAFNISD